ncbi:hypothetical protein SAMN05518847_105320 [Paenibacillus sp. OV219]|nr:hypothetical protein SAMN05518847_105320 [Paenibacillus sp. OV219]
MRDRCGGVDYNPVFGNAFFRLMQAPNDFPFLWSATPVSWVQCHSLINPPETGFQVDLKDKHAVEEINEFGKISRTTAEKCYRLFLIGDQSFYFIYMPNVVFGFKAIRRGTSFRVALISQFTVTMNGMVAAPLQFVADRSFAGTGNAYLAPSL